MIAKENRIDAEISETSRVSEGKGRVVGSLNDSNGVIEDVDEVGKVGGGRLGQFRTGLEELVYVRSRKTDILGQLSVFGQFVEDFQENIEKREDFVELVCSFEGSEEESGLFEDGESYEGRQVEKFLGLSVEKKGEVVAVDQGRRVFGCLSDEDEGKGTGD